MASKIAPDGHAVISVSAGLRKGQFKSSNGLEMNEGEVEIFAGVLTVRNYRTTFFTTNHPFLATLHCQLLYCFTGVHKNIRKAIKAEGFQNLSAGLVLRALH